MERAVCVTMPRAGSMRTSGSYFTAAMPVCDLKRYASCRYEAPAFLAITAGDSYRALDLGEREPRNRAGQGTARDLPRHS